MLKKNVNLHVCLMTAASLLLVGFPCSTLALDGFPFRILVSGNINGVALSAEGIGTVDPIGVYTASMTFSNIPPAFHPVAITAFTVSICCNAQAEEKNGALNMASLGLTGYHADRELVFSAADTIKIVGTVRMEDTLSLCRNGKRYGLTSR